MQKLFSFIKKRRTLIIILLILITPLIAGFFFASKKQEVLLPELTPTPTDTKLNLLKTNPSGNKLQSVFNATAILFYFDAPIDLSTAEVVIDPEIEIITDPVRNNTYGIAVRPAGEWKEKTQYTITIEKGLKSLDNRQLQEDVVHQFQFEFPDDVMVY